jgi:hypothetical protein
MRTTLARVALALTLGAGSASAAPPVLPATMSYQGVLLDANGDPQTGNVDLTIRIYDALTGGTLLYKQVFTGVALTDGVFSVQLGPAGSATDSPTNPLTTSFEDALGGDLAATGPSRFLGVTVGASGPLPRTQIASVPYALRSSRAASADQADVATDTDAVGGLPSEVLTEIWDNVSFDGGGPANGDPSEGLQDTDGDGLANFVDSDNDNDTIGDSTDPGINLVTPILGVQPATFIWSAGPVLQATGSNFEPGMSATFGGDPVTPLNVTATSFDVDLGVEPKGTHVVVVTRLNGQTGSTTVNVTADSSHGTNTVATTRLTLDSNQAQTVFISGGTAKFDSDGDGDVEVLLGGGSAKAVAYTSADQHACLRDAAPNGPTGIVFFIDSNGSNTFLSNEGVVLQPSGTVSAGTIDFGPSDERVAAYLRTDAGTTTAVVGHDRDANGDFLGTNEVVPIETLLLPAAPVADMAIDGSGHVAFAWYDGAAGGRVRLAWDRSGDGDFDDTVGANPELSTLLGVGSICLGLAFDSNGVLSIVHGAFGSPPTLLRDLDGDGDFGDAGEALALGTGSAGGCDAAARAAGLSVVHTEGGNVFLLVDRNGDDDFGDAAEVRHLQLAGTGPVDPVAVTVSETERSIVATRSDLFLDVAP